MSLTHLSNISIVKRLENMRLDRLAKNSALIKTNCLTSERCPKCTLKLPCKHYSSVEELFGKGKLFKKHEWQSMTDEQRNEMIQYKLSLDAP